MPAMTGVIRVCQEGRFRLYTADGRSELFVLSHSAPVEPQDLEDLVRRKALVTVRFEEAPGRVAQLAEDITAAGTAQR